nr:hypothetical protein F987_02015 [Acinetobacter gyllenbergii NIPH 230]
MKTQKKIVLDTKWKLLDQNNRAGRFGLKDSDVQQMFAYSYFYLDHQSEVILIYPYQSQKFDKELCFNFNVQGKGVLKAIPFDVENPDNIVNAIATYDLSSK